MADKKNPPNFPKLFEDDDFILICELCGESTFGSSNGPLCNCVWKVCPWCHLRFKAKLITDDHGCQLQKLVHKEAVRIASTSLDDDGIDFVKSFPPIRKQLVDVATETPKDQAPRLVFPSTGDKDLDKMIGDVIETIGTKGQEYTIGDADRLKNFKRAAEKVSRRKNRQPMDMVDVWQIFFDKQMSAVEAYIANGFEVKSNEPISGRIMDCIVYLILFYKMTVEIEEKKLNQHKAEHGLPA
jgi:hypothetical protein